MTIDENKPRGLAPPFCQRILKMAWFHILILILVLANAIVTATIHFEHRRVKLNKIDAYYYAEVRYYINTEVDFIYHESTYTVLHSYKFPGKHTHLCHHNVDIQYTVNHLVPKVLILLLSEQSRVPTQQRENREDDCKENRGNFKIWKNTGNLYLHSKFIV